MSVKQRPIWLEVLLAIAILALSAVILTTSAAGADRSLMVFSSPTCGPCQEMKPAVRNLISAGAAIVIVDVSQSPDIARQYNVSSVPTIIAIDAGRVAGRVVGKQSEAQLRSMLGGQQRSRQAPSSRVYETANFIVTAPTPLLAMEVAQTAEAYRCYLYRLWFGEDIPGDWGKPCNVEVKLTPPRFSGAGSTSFVRDSGEIFGWQASWSGTREQLLRDVVPHEVMHTVLHTRYRKAGQPLPRWLDEGVAMLAESPKGVGNFRQALTGAVGQGRYIPVASLLAMRDYPSDANRMAVMYGQGHSMAEYLLTHYGGRKQLVRYMDTGAATGDWQGALYSVYRIRDCGVFQGRWLQWIRGRRQAVGGVISGPTSYQYMPNAPVCPDCGQRHQRQVTGAWVEQGPQPSQPQSQAFPQRPAELEPLPSFEPPSESYTLADSTFADAPPVDPVTPALPPTLPATLPVDSSRWNDVDERLATISEATAQQQANAAEQNSLLRNIADAVKQRAGAKAVEVATSTGIGWLPMLAGSGPIGAGIVIGAYLLRRRVSRRRRGDDGFFPQIAAPLQVAQPLPITYQPAQTIPQPQEVRSQKLAPVETRVRIHPEIETRHG